LIKGGCVTGRKNSNDVNKGKVTETKQSQSVVHLLWGGTRSGRGSIHRNKNMDVVCGRKVL